MQELCGADKHRPASLRMRADAVFYPSLFPALDWCRNRDVEQAEVWPDLVDPTLAHVLNQLFHKSLHSGPRSRKGRKVVLLPVPLAGQRATVHHLGDAETSIIFVNETDVLLSAFFAAPLATAVTSLLPEAMRIAEELALPHGSWLNDDTFSECVSLAGALQHSPEIHQRLFLSGKAFREMLDAHVQLILLGFAAGEDGPFDLAFFDLLAKTDFPSLEEGATTLSRDDIVAAFVGMLNPLVSHEEHHIDVDCKIVPPTLWDSREAPYAHPRNQHLRAELDADARFVMDGNGRPEGANDLSFIGSIVGRHFAEFTSLLRVCIRKDGPDLQTIIDLANYGVTPAGSPVSELIGQYPTATERAHIPMVGPWGYPLQNPQLAGAFAVIMTFMRQTCLVLLEELLDAQERDGALARTFSQLAALDDGMFKSPLIGSDPLRQRIDAFQKLSDEKRKVVLMMLSKARQEPLFEAMEMDNLAGAFGARMSKVKAQVHMTEQRER